VAKSLLVANVASAVVALLVSVPSIAFTNCNFLADQCYGTLLTASIATGLGTEGHGSVVDRWQSQ
jgi:hypothetical protein